MHRYSTKLCIVALICLLCFHVVLAQEPPAHASGAAASAAATPATAKPAASPATSPAPAKPAAAAPAEPKPETTATPKTKPPVTMANEFVRVVVNSGPNEAGRFSIDTTGGDPSRPESKNKRLIFGGNKPWTSYSTVRLDNVSYVVGGPTKRRAGLGARYGNTLAGPAVSENQIAYSEMIGDDVEVVAKIGLRPRVEHAHARHRRHHLLAHQSRCCRSSSRLARDARHHVRRQ